MAFDAASLATRAAQLRSSGSVMDRPKSSFKVTQKHIGKRTKISSGEEQNRDWWIDYEQQNR